MNKPVTLLISMLIAIGGCQTTASNGDVPALIANPTPASRAALQEAVNHALHSEILLADDALTASSILVIERAPARSMQNLPATGRNMESAIQFRLVANDSDCILIDTRDGSRYLLKNTNCVSE